MSDNIFSRRSTAPSDSPYKPLDDTDTDEQAQEPLVLADTDGERERAAQERKARRNLATVVQHSEQMKKYNHTQYSKEVERREQQARLVLLQTQAQSADADQSTTSPSPPPPHAKFMMSVARAIRGALSLALHASSEHRDEAEQLDNRAHMQHETRQKHKLLVGAQSKTLARYWIEHNLKNRFQATMGWYLNEAHHDPTGADPAMISMFLVAFLARAVYRTALEAIVLVVLVAVVTTVIWFLVRACWPVTARHLDRTESLLLAFVYDIFAFAAGLFVASYTLQLWPGLQSYAEACGEVDSDSILWVDCTNGRTFVIIAYLFIFAFLGVFASVYRVTILALLLTAPFMIILGFHTNEPLGVFYTFTFTSLSMAYFYATFARPIRDSYVWNLLLGMSWYLFVVSVLVGFGF